MAIMAGLLRAMAPENKREKANTMTPEFLPKSILRIIFLVYIYMMLMATGSVLNCESKKDKECGDQWTQAFTVSSGAVTTLWAYITDNPIQSGSKMPRSRTPVAPPEPITGDTNRSRRRVKLEE